MKVYRSEKNPIIRPEDVIPSQKDFEVICVFNAGVARLGDEIILLLRVAERPVNTNTSVYLCPIYDASKKTIEVKEFDVNDINCDFSDSRLIKAASGNFLTSISHLRVARSKDGINFEIENKPSVSADNIYESYGIEDPRITQIGDVYYINYSAISSIGITTYLVSTRDFRCFERMGNIFHPDNKDVEIFPEKINGKYYALHRPSISHFGKPDIWIAESPDLICWGNHRYLMGTRDNYWDNGRIGGSAVPFKVEDGWLEIYHGATKEDKYCLGAVLLDEKEPWKVIARSEQPILEPQEKYETGGFFGNVVFSCGALCEDGIIKIYYGAADTFLCYAEIELEEVLKSLHTEKTVDGPAAEGCAVQLERFKRNKGDITGEILIPQGVGQADVYNPSVPFICDGQSIIAGRVEERSTEKSKVMFFAEKHTKLELIKNAPVFELQDPFITCIGNEIILGGVRVEWEGHRAVTWYTDFYKGTSLNTLEYFTSGPEHMKDIRLLEMRDGRIAVFSRPQGKKMLDCFGCIAKIGFTIVNSLEELTPQAIADAQLLEGQFLPEEWGGCNQLYILKNGLIGVIGHKAFGEGEEAEKILHYYSMAFAVNPETREVTQTKIICSRDCFPEGPAKQPRLKDVTFTSGIIRNADKTAVLYSGLSDCQVGKIIIPDPFLEYEEN